MTKTLSMGDIPKTPLRFLWYVTMEYKWIAFWATFLTIIAAGLSQSTSYFFKLIIDASETGDMHRVLFYALMYPVATLIVQLLYRCTGYLGMNWTTHSKKYSLDILTQYTLHHSNQYFANRFAGSLLSKLSNVGKAIDQFVPDFLWTHLNAAVSFVVTAVFVWNADALSGVFFIGLLVMLIVTNSFFAPRKKLVSKKAAEIGTKVRGTIVDILTNISATRQYVRTQDEVDRVQVVLEEHRIASIRSWGYTEIMLLVNTVIIFVFSIGMFYFLIQRWSMGDIGAGDFVLILSLYSQIIGTLMFIGRSFNNTARSLGEMEEGLTDLLQPYEINDCAGAKKLQVRGGVIEWKDATFRYEDNVVFDTFNLVIPEGQRVGLVGTSGAGKSTFVSLILRQNELAHGAILIDGQNIAEVTQDSLRKNIAVVPQEPILFHRSIKENILYGNPDATDEEVIAVAKKAQAHDFIIKLGLGYDTLVGERGVKLSGGQKQRIAIARAMLKNAPILVLDEATSALDSQSEMAIQKALHELMVGKTVIAIAHRLSTLREMDRIIVLEEGKIVEDGTHDTLTKTGGTYARLWEHQAGGFIVE